MNTIKPILDDFYAYKFYTLGNSIRANPYARKTVKTVQQKGLKIVLTTNPIFLKSAILDRMKWANIHDLQWDLITSYKEIHFCKP